MPLLLFAIPIASTLLGGALAVRFRGCLTLLLGLGAGVLLGAAFLDLLPEALMMGSAAGVSSANILAVTLLSFLLFYSLKGSLDAWSRQAFGWNTRRAAASMLIFHSFRDGMAIGAAYAASRSAGYVVALGIAAHDLGDGMNTVLLISGSEAPTRSTYLFLLADAVAPFLGGLLTAWWVLSAKGSVALLVLSAGFFLQMATGDFLPETGRGESSRLLVSTYVLLGAGFVYVANVVFGRS